MTFILLGTAHGGDNLAVVERFIAAFNEHDVDAMLELTADEVRWMSIAEERVSVEASGEDQLRASMSAYFSDVPSASARLRSAAASGRFVHTVEEAGWTSGGEQRRQCSVAVYELESAEIVNVWYFPAHGCP